ncbi:MAG TPA: hypothetical protein VMS74_05385 [Acidimicrobiia bacterium]|nr:hypothetical protein [Acidimicrobiia bacterium]
MTSTHHLARQPIVDRSGVTLAYEVLFRADRLAQSAVFSDAVRATRTILGHSIAMVPTFAKACLPPSICPES